MAASALKGGLKESLNRAKREFSGNGSITHEGFMPKWKWVISKNRYR